jgi:hypothetical protein
MNKITEDLHPYEYLLVKKTREIENGEVLVKVQDGLPLVTEETKKKRTDFRKMAEALGLMRKGA